MLLPLPDGDVDLATGDLRRPGQEGRLTSRERALLAYLAARPGKVVATEELLREVWGCGPHVVTRAAFHTMRRLRARIEPDPGTPRMLFAEHGVGYRFEPWASPAPTTTLHGREADTRQLAALLRAEGPAVVVVGPPGVGKSALLREAVRDQAQALYVDLEGVVSVASVHDRLAVMLGIAGPGDVAERVAHALGARPIVVLDGAEGVVHELAPVLMRWRAASPSTRVVLGSRVVPPGLAGADLRLLPLRPLALAPAVAFLEERLAAAGLEPQPEELTRRVALAGDRLPLALHLAAVEARYVPLAVVAERLAAGGLDPLTHAVERSLERLPAEARRQLGVLARFARAARREDLAGVGVEERTVRLLLDHGLACRTTRPNDPSTDLVDLYAAVRTAVVATIPPAERTAADDAHASWFARLGAPSFLARLDDEGGAGRRVLQDLLPEVEHAMDGLPDDDARRAPLLCAAATVRASFGGLRTLADAVRRAVAASAAPASFLGFWGNLDVAAVLGLAEACVAGPVSPELAPFLAMHAWTVWTLKGDHVRAHESAVRGRAAALGLGWRALAGRLACAAASSARQTEGPRRALELVRLAAADGEAVDDLLVVGEARNLEGVAQMELGMTRLAALAYEEAAAAAERAGSLRLRMLVQGNQGILCRLVGEDGQAVERLRDALSAATLAGDRLSEARVRLNLGVSLSTLGRSDEALHELDVAQRIADALQVERLQPTLGVNRVLFLLAAGDWAAAAVREPMTLTTPHGRLQAVCVAAARWAEGRGEVGAVEAALTAQAADHAEYRTVGLAWSTQAAMRVGDEAGTRRLAARARAAAEDPAVPAPIRALVGTLPTPVTFPLRRPA